MKERRKRSSKSNLGSSRSLGSSSMLAAAAPATPQPSANPPSPPEEGQNSFLPTVKEESPERHNLSQELSHSNILAAEDDNDN